LGSCRFHFSDDTRSLVNKMQLSPVMTAATPSCSVLFWRDIMKLTLLAAVSAFSVVTAAAHAESEGAGDPFAFRVPGVTTINQPAYADTGSAAFPNLNGRSSRIVIVGGPDTVPMTGSEATVQTAASLPRGFSDGTVSNTQAQSVARFVAGREERARLAAQLPTKAHRG
jgi:hypothetical protein